MTPLFYNPTFFPNGTQHLETSKMLINGLQKELRIRAVQAFSSQQTVTELFLLLTSCLTDENYYLNNKKLIKKLISLVNSKLSPGFSLTEGQLQTIHDLIKKSDLRKDTPNKLKLLPRKLPLVGSYTTNSLNVNPLILATESLYFQAQLRNPLKPFNELWFEGSAEALRFFDHYFNYGTIEKIDVNNTELMIEVMTLASKWGIYRLIENLESMEQWCTVTPSNMMNLYARAFDLHNKTIQQNLQPYLLQLEENIDESNYLMIFEFAHYCELKELEHACLRFFKKHLWDIFQQFPTELEAIQSFVSERNLPKEPDSIKNEKGKEKVKEIEDLNIQQTDIEAFQHPFKFLREKITHFSVEFLDSLHISELLVLLIFLPEKVESLDFSGFTHTQIDLLLPWLPKNLKSLNLNGVEISKDALSTITKNCQTLQHLILRPRNEKDIDFTPLTNLTQLKSIDCWAYEIPESGEVFKKIVNNCPKLEKIKTNISSGTKSLIQQISQSAKKLNSLFLIDYSNELPPQNEDIEELARTHADKITSFYVLTGNFFSRGLNLFPLLEDLKIRNFDQLTETVRNLPENSHIKKLKILFDEDEVDSTAVDNIEKILIKCPRLKELNFAFFNNDPLVIDRIFQMVKTHCKKLEFWKTSLSSDQIVQLPPLKKLTIHDSSNLITILDSQTELNDLDIWGHLEAEKDQLKDKKFSNIENLNCKSLGEKFTIGDVFPNLKKLALTTIPENKNSLVNLSQQLQKLNKLEILELEIEDLIDSELINYVKLIPNLNAIRLNYFLNHWKYENTTKWIDIKMTAYNNLNQLLNEKPNLKIYLPRAFRFISGENYVKKEILERAQIISQQCKQAFTSKNIDQEMTSNTKAL